MNPLSGVPAEEGRRLYLALLVLLLVSLAGLRGRSLRRRGRGGRLFGTFLVLLRLGRGGGVIVVLLGGAVDTVPDAGSGKGRGGDDDDFLHIGCIGFVIFERIYIKFCVEIWYN